MESRMVGKSVRVFIGGSWVEGFITEYHPDRGYQVQFFDGDSDWLPSIDERVEVLNDEDDERQLGPRVPSAEEVDDINFFDENEGDEELAIIPNKPLVKHPSERSMQSQERRMKHADEKGSRRNSNASSGHNSRHSPRVAEVHDINPDDERLMEENIDDSIMGKDVIDIQDSPRVLVNTYDPADPSDDEAPRILPRQSSNRSNFNQKTQAFDEPHPTEDVLLDMEDGEFNFPLEHLPHPIEYYQEKSHEIVVSQSVLLQPQSVLLVGSVLSATFSPASATHREAKENYAESKEGRNSMEDFFFRVLFIEGGSQPIMFRCKTPIFTSNTTLVKVPSFPTEYHSIWRENLFRCDMLMPEIISNDAKMKTQPLASNRLPSSSQRKGKTLSAIPEAKEPDRPEEEEGESDQHHTAPFPVTGEIVISVYKVRTNGGNDLMGQMVIDLDKMSKYGTYEYFNEICEGRCYSGKYPLTLPTHTTSTTANAKPIVVGEIELHLVLAWKIAVNEVNANVATTTGMGSRPPIRPKSASGVSIAAGSKKATNPAAATTVGGTSKKKSTMTTGEPRKIISALQRKQQQDRRRIELENKKLQQFIQKASGKTTSGTAYTKTKGPNPLKSNPQVNNFLISPSPSLVADTKDSRKNPEQAVYDKYLQVYNQLKKNIAEEDTLMTNLKGRYNNVNIQIKKYQTLIEKAKLAGGGGGGGNHSITSQSRTSNRLRESKEGSPMRETFTARHPKPFESTGIRSEEIKDPEYQSIKEEYEVMQRIRKSLIDRIVKAKEVHQRYQHDIQSMLSQRHVLQNRIDAIHEKQEQQKQQTYGATATVVFDESQSQFEKMSQQQYQNGPSKRGKEESDIDTFLTLTALLQEKQYYLEQIDENVDYYALQSNYEELNRSYLVLQEKLNQINKDIEDLQRQKEEMSPMMTRAGSKEVLPSHRSESKEPEGGLIEKEIVEKRELIYFLQKLLLESDVEFRLSQVFGQMKENDIQLMYLQMKQKERDEATLSAISSIPNFSSIALSNQNSRESLLQGLSYSRSNHNSEAKL